MRTQLALLAGLLLTGAGCGTQDSLDDPLEDPSAPRSDGKADSLATSANYYILDADTNECTPPACGGYSTRIQNTSFAFCADGTVEGWCHVAKLDLSALKLDSQTLEMLNGKLRSVSADHRSVLLHGQMLSGDSGLGELQVDEAWTAETTVAAPGVFYRVTDTGVRCSTSPCETFHEAKLNSSTTRALSSVDLSAIASQDERDAAQNAMASADGAIIAARSTRGHVTDEGPGGTAWRLVASQVFSKVKTQ
jgi:hypothetical protein